jgi:hypothetical protein
MASFADGIDAGTGSGSGGEWGFWFFRSDRTVKTDPAGDNVTVGPCSVTAPEAWPALRSTACENGADAALFSSSGFWFFKGNQTVKTNIEGTSILTQGAITDPGNWPALTVSDRAAAPSV